MYWFCHTSTRCLPSDQGVLNLPSIGSQRVRNSLSFWPVLSTSPSHLPVAFLSVTAILIALEKEMATRSSVLAWRIPGTGDAGSPAGPGRNLAARGRVGVRSHRARGVRPRLEGKQMTPLSSRVATRVSWSPLSGLKTEPHPAPRRQVSPRPCRAPGGFPAILATPGSTTGTDRKSVV